MEGTGVCWYSAASTCATAHFDRLMLPRPQVVFEHPRALVAQGAARLKLAVVSIMGVL